MSDPRTKALPAALLFLETVTVNGDPGAAPRVLGCAGCAGWILPPPSLPPFFSRVRYHSFCPQLLPPPSGLRDLFPSLPLESPSHPPY